MSGALNLPDPTFRRTTLNGLAADATRNIRWQTSAVDRWNFGPDSSVEAAPVTTTASAVVAAGNNVIPISSNVGITSGMQISATGIPATAYVVSSTGGSGSVNATAAVDSPSGSFVITVNDATAAVPGLLVTGTGIPGSSIVALSGGTGTNPSTTCSVTSTSDTTLHVVSVANIVVGMKATGTGILADTYVTDVLGVPNVVVFLSKPASVNSGATVTFSTAFVMSKPSIGTVTNGSSINFAPNMVISQNTVSPGISSGDTLTFYSNAGASLVLSAANDVGGTWLSPFGISRQTGVVSTNEGLSIQPSVTQAPTGNTTLQPLFSSVSTWGGQYTFPAGGAFLYYHQIIINDQTQFTHRGSVGFRLFHNYGGVANTAGSRVAMAVDVAEKPGFPTLGGFGSGFNNQIIAFQATALAGENAGGTALTFDGVAGGIYSLATYTRLLGPGDGYATGATNYLELTAMNMNCAVHAGASALHKSFIVMSNEDGDVVQGSLSDAAIVLATNVATAVGWKNYLAAGRPQGAWPMDAAGSMWGTYRGSVTKPLNVGYGLAWKDINFVTAAIATPGFLLDGNGTVNANAAVLSTTGNTTTLDIKLIHVTAATVASSSGTWNVGDGMYDASGNQWQAATVDGSNNLSTVTLVGPAYIAGAAPSNPVTVTGQASGNAGGTLTLTWSAPNLLQINPSGAATKIGGTIGFNNTSPIAKPTVTGSRAANAALASLLTALANYGLVVDSSS